MAAKRKSSTPPAPAARSSSSSDDSSPDEEKLVAKPNPSIAKTPKHSEREDDESDSGSEPNPDLPAEAVIAPPKPAEPKDSSKEDKEEEPKSAVKGPESEPNRKKMKASMAEKSSLPGQRLWTFEDELVLLRALLDYHTKTDKLPPPKECDSFLSGISGRISFPATIEQLKNKIRKMRTWYKLKKKNDKFSQPHDVEVFELCKVLFEVEDALPQSDAGMENPKQKQKQKKGSNGMGANGPAVDGASPSGDAAGGDAGNGYGVRGCDMAGSHFFLDWLIKDLTWKQQCPMCISKVEDLVARIGESSAQDLGAKSRELRIQEIKFQASQEKLRLELLDVLVSKMSD